MIISKLEPAVTDFSNTAGTAIEEIVLLTITLLPVAAFNNISNCEGVSTAFVDCPSDLPTDKTMADRLVPAALTAACKSLSVTVKV